LGIPAEMINEIGTRPRVMVDTFTKCVL
jgi:hypothetical protein